MRPATASCCPPSVTDFTPLPAAPGRCLCSLLPCPFVCKCHNISTIPSFRSCLGFTLSPQAHRRTRPNRVRFTTDCVFASGCSPPRLTTTQLSRHWRDYRERASPGGGLSPPKSRLLPGARTPAFAGMTKYAGFTIGSCFFNGLHWHLKTCPMPAPCEIGRLNFSDAAKKL